MRFSAIVCSALITTSLHVIPASAQTPHPIEGIWRSVELKDDEGNQVATRALIFAFGADGSHISASDQDGGADLEKDTCLGSYAVSENRLTVTLSKCTDPDMQESVTMDFTIEGDNLTFTQDGGYLRFRRVGKPF
jgi:hypothetical protein